MKNYSSLNWKAPSFTRWLFSLIAFLGILSTQVYAQSSANYAFTTNTTGSLGLDANSNIVDMTTGTTQLVAADIDDGSSAVTNIGFDFFLMGVRYTQFSASSNGVIQLGSSALSTTNYLLSGGNAASPVLGALAADLRTGISGKVHYKLIGSAPNRCLVVEFSNMSLTYVATPGSNDGTYQVRLYETSGVIEYVYGSMFRNASTTTTAAIYCGFSVNTTANNFAAVTTSTNTVSTTTFNLNSYTTSANIPNLHSTAEGTRRTYKFTPPVPVAPSNLTFTNVGGAGMTLNWQDNATNEVGYAIYRSLDGVTYTYVGMIAANSVLYNATGLNLTTNYFWKVYAVTEGSVSSPVLSGSQATGAASLSGIKTVGAGGDYNNLTTAFAAINTFALNGDIELQLISGYPASPETYPIASSTEVPTGIYHVKVYPTVSGLSITSPNTTGTLNLNNAFNITFDGRVNQTGANDLVIANTNAGASYAVQFINDARNNTLSHVILQSTNTSTSSGTIVIGTTTNPNGNDNNTIDNCDIKDGATTPVNAIYSVGTTTTTAQFNDNVTISNNNISNFFSAGSSSIGVFAGSGSNAWTISNNKLYQTATRTYTTGNTHNGIQVNHSAGNGFVITGNTIGFASNTGTGVYTMAGTVSNRFIGINVSAGTTTASSVQGNTISGFSLATSSGASTGNGVFAGINITNGNVNVGNTTPNIIGATTGTGAITATPSTSGGLIVGINSSSSGVVNISNNLIGALTANGSTTSIAASVTGVQVSGGTPTINGNTIGSTTTANSINSPTVTAAATSPLIRGIDVTSGVSTATSIQSNTIANLNQSGTGTGANIRGISYAGSGLATISLNTIYNLSGATSNVAVSGGATAVQGILHTGSATTGAVINKNTIYTLSATNAGAVQTNVSGIGYSNPTTGSITNNTIYDLRNASTMAVVTTPPTASGILIRALATSVQISNNMISLGDVQTTNTQFMGIWNSFSTVGAINVYHNSISVSGTASAGALPTFGILRGDNSGTAVTTPVDIRNNIFSNTRSGGTGKHYAIANQATAASAAGWGTGASNYNVLNATAATVGLWGATDETFSAWRTASAGDANSFSGIPVVFVSVPTANLHLNMGTTPTPIESGGSTIAAVTTDIDNQSRPGPSGSVNGGATAPDLGADEIDGAPALPVITLNSVTPPATTQCVTAPRVVSVNVTTPVGVLVNVSLAYTLNGVAQTPITMTNSSGSTYTATIPSPTPTNATIAWAVAATNSSGLSASYTGTPYSDDPLLGVTAAASNTVSPVCAGSPSLLSVVLSGTTAPSYTTPTPVTNPTTDEDLGNITITQGATTILNNTTARNSLTGTIGTASGTSGSYSNFTGFGPYNMTAGQTYNFSLTTLQDVTAYANAAAIYIDYNRNGIFTDAGETVYASPATTSGGHTETGSFTIPASAFNGMTRMRLIVLEGAVVPGPTVTVGYGEYEEYLLNITSPNNGGGTVPTITSVSWSDGTTTVGTGGLLTINPTATHTYTGTVTALGCTVVSSGTTVVATALPSAPTATNSAQCGVQIPTASVTSTTGAPTPTFHWYSAATGGALMQNSTSTTYTTTVGVTTTFYVSELNSGTGCESPRTPVTVNVSTPDPVAVSASAAAICVGSSVTLTGSNTNPTPFQSYTYSFQSVTTGSGAETSVAGNPATITPTAAGTYVYTVTGVDGGCAATSTVSVLINALPVISSATALPATVCSNTAITLQGQSNILTTGGTAIVGAGASSGSSNYYTPFYHFYGGVKDQFIIRASELTAAGLSAGNITALGLDITTVGTTYAGFTIHVGNTSNTDLSAGLVAVGTLTQVYSNATLTLTASSLNTFTFATPFPWDGVSNIVVQTSWSNNNGGGNNSGLLYDNTAYVSNAYFRADNSTPAVILAGTPASSTASARPKMTFTGTAVTNLTPTLSWAWTPGSGLNTATATTSINNTTGSPITQAFTVTATNSTTGCVNTATTAAVTINPATVAPVAANSTQCGQGVPTASVTGSGTPGNTFAWYTVATGGTALAGETGSALTAYTINTTTTFYVAESNGTCQSARVPVTVTVTTAPTISVSGTSTICNGSATSLTASSSNDPNYTYTWSGGLGTGATVSAAPTANTTYTVTASDLSGGANNGCVVNATYAITVNPTPSGVIANASVSTICQGTSVNLTSAGVTNTTVPFAYSEGFEAWPPTGWTFINAGTGNQWVAGTTPHTGTGSMKYTYSSTDAANAWGMAPGQSMVAGTPYTISFWYRVESATYPERMKVTIGNAATVAAQTTILWNNNGGTNLSNTTYAQGTVTFTPATTGTYYLGFNCYSLTDQYLMHVDDISITANVPATPTFAWTSSPAGFTSAVQSPTGVAPTTTTTYTVAVSNSFGCSATASSTVTVNHGTTSTVAHTACSSYTLNGTTYNTSGTYTQTLTNAAGCDSTLTLNLTITQPTAATVAHTACSSYTLNGTTYNTSGTYTQTLTNAAGCDSTLTLNLTINQPTTHTITAAACSSYALNGTTYTSTGTYTQTLTNAIGCDSTITLNLTINQPTSSTLSFAGCGSYTYNGTTYNTSGTYNQTLMNAAGCDSLVTLNITINQPTTATVNGTGCNSYTYNGTTYTVSGTYTQTLVNANGCDSTVTINVALTNSFNTITDAACGSYTYNGTTYTSTGTYTQVLTNSVGCDSTVTLNLTISQPTTSALTQAACSSYTLNGTTYTSSGTYTQVLMNAAGCDSTLTLNLTINQPTAHTMTASACTSYTLNGTTYTASGAYTQTLMNAAGCDSTLTLNLTILGSPTAVATDNGDNSMTASAGSTYQWIMCATGLPLAGATTQTYTATVNGTYAVVVTNAGGCSDTSNCVTINNIGLNELTDATIHVFPNPTNSDVTITMSATKATIKVMDAQGKLLQQKAVMNGEKVNLSTYETGVYFLHIQTENGSAIERVVKN